nr:uncharacterized protein LOC100184437 [Ciona intestinalis]|eukprot:XP_002127161.1 uncharacterized protein LOC100184437 [Ciona intestinalis]
MSLKSLLKPSVISKLFEPVAASNVLKTSQIKSYVHTTPKEQGKVVEKFVDEITSVTKMSEADYKVLKQVKTPPKEVEFRGSNFNFPCLNRRFLDGPEPTYHKIEGGYKTYHHKQPFHFYYNDGVLPEIEVAYETWGNLNSNATNAILLYTGLSASSHAASQEDNMKPGWWEKFIGPGRPLDTNKFYVICANQLGGCYGTTGPSSKNPLNGEYYGTHFPMVSIKDMVESQMHLLTHLGIDKVYAAVGSSLGGMCSIAMSSLYPDKVARVISISGCAKTHPTSIALRYLQRRCIMEDPDWKVGHYYEGEYPLKGMKLAREIATMTYRSGLEWEKRFGRLRLPGEEPSLCHNFEIEQYIEYQGLQFATKYDPNSLLYISKAMDLFDINEFYEDEESSGLSRIKCPTLVMGVTTDLLFPVKQQRDLAQGLKRSGNSSVTYYELNSIYGHDTFLLDLNSVGTAVKGFLETQMSVNGNLSKSDDSIIL